jgi:hypothetical protein
MLKRGRNTSIGKFNFNPETYAKLSFHLFHENIKISGAYFT